jgi:hypothetical protein
MAVTFIYSRIKTIQPFIPELHQPLHFVFCSIKIKYNPNSFSARYNLNKLVYYEAFHSIVEAIAREKQIKGGSRNKKEDLINSINSKWNDLYDDLVKEL